MAGKKCVAMLLAGGQGSRLGLLTENIAKPAVPFGGKYRIIDFTLSNCVNSNIYTVGVLTQYQPLELNAYIGNGQPWDLDRNDGGVFLLPPYVKGKGGEWYKGTANAIYQNMAFIDQFSPEYVLVLSGDHIYKMNYKTMIEHHEQNKADGTIAVIEVPPSETHRFGIMDTDGEGRITAFAEKPKNANSTKASMGVYVFNWETLRECLKEDEENPDSSNDFGKDVIPLMLKKGLRLFAYPYTGYWKDVGTVQSLYEANMDLLRDPPGLNLYDPAWRIYGRNPVLPPHYIAKGVTVSNCLVTEGCSVYGNISNSILFAGVFIDIGAVVEDSILMPGVHVAEGACVTRAIVGENAYIGSGSIIGEVPLLAGGAEENEGITVISPRSQLDAGTRVPRGCMYKGQRRK